MDRKKRAIRACRVNDLIFREIIDRFDSFKTEKDIETYILKRFRDNKMGSSYPPIVANNNSVIHAKPRKKKLSRGFLVLDFGAKFKGMCTDMTRTLFVGKANKKERELYRLVKDCQERCVKKVKLGVSCKELHALSRKLLKGYVGYFPHALGHGVGSKVHRKPRISVKSDEVISKGFITIEPGIYIKNKRDNFGIRIEDTLYVDRKVEVLCKASRKLIEV